MDRCPYLLTYYYAVETSTPPSYTLSHNQRKQAQFFTRIESNYSTELHSTTVSGYFSIPSVSRSDMLTLYVVSCQSRYTHHYIHDTARQITNIYKG